MNILTIIAFIFIVQRCIINSRSIVSHLYIYIILVTLCGIINYNYDIKLYNIILII